MHYICSCVTANRDGSVTKYYIYRRQFYAQFFFCVLITVLHAYSWKGTTTTRVGRAAFTGAYGIALTSCLRGYVTYSQERSVFVHTFYTCNIIYRCYTFIVRQRNAGLPVLPRKGTYSNTHLYSVCTYHMIQGTTKEHCKASVTTSC